MHTQAEQVNRLRQLIAQDNSLQALDELSDLAYPVPEIHNTVILLNARYRRLVRAELAGVITREQAGVDKNVLNIAILQVIDSLFDRLPVDKVPVTSPKLDIESVPVSAQTQPEKILGVNNLKQISWVAVGLEVAKSVCRVIAPNGFGTGFLISADLVMTNNHVIGSVSEARNTVIEFNYQQAPNGRYETACRYRLNPDDRFHTSPKLDYTLVAVEHEPHAPALERWGKLIPNAGADPVRGELALVIQHPNGGLKQISMTANWVMGSTAHRLWYTTDTMPGSSGSPVLNDLWQVVAIHHAGGVELPGNGSNLAARYANEGILMSSIRPDAQAVGLWPAE